MRRVATVVSVAGVVLAVMAGPALALDANGFGVFNPWPRSTKYISVSGTSTELARAYGDGATDNVGNGDQYRGRGYVRDMEPGDGQGVYFKMTSQTSSTFCLTGGYADCSVDWAPWRTDTMGAASKWYDDTWSSQYVAVTSIDASARFMRGLFWVCEAQGMWNPDDCTPGPTANEASRT